MYKTNDEIIKIQAKATTPIPTGVVFWSHDRGTAKLRFELLNGPVAQNIAEGSTVPIRLEFNSDTAEGGKGKHDYLATIEDRVNGIVSIVLADNTMGYVGPVTGSIYIDFPNSTSIDTAGRFKFEIRRSPIDENTPEVEDYFFNGWSEIQKKLDEKIALTDLEIEKLRIKLDNLDKKTDGIKATQEAILKSIADNELATKDDLEKAKQESSANVIYQLIGKENAKINIVLDYQDKITGSVVENPHKAAAGFSSVIPVPAQITGEVSQHAYNALSALDGDVTSPYTATNKDMTYFLVQWNVLEALERELGSKFFIDRGATTTKEKVEIAKEILIGINPVFWGYGKSPSGNKLNFKIWINNSSWAGTRSHNASSVTKMEYNSTGTSTNNYLSDDGYLYASAYAEPSDGTIASTVVGDYAQLNLQIEISANDHIESKIAHFSGKNSVSLSEPQTVEGLKNFSDGVQSNGIDVATQDMTKVTLFQSTELSNVKGTAAGIVWPIDEAAIVFGGVGAHARRGGTSEPGTIYFNEAGQYLIELLWFVNSGTATRKYVYMDWIKHGTTDLLFRSGIGKINGFSYTSSVPGGGIITMGKDEGVDILLKTNVEDLIAGVRIYYIKITKIG